MVKTYLFKKIANDLELPSFRGKLLGQSFRYELGFQTTFSNSKLDL